MELTAELSEVKNYIDGKFERNGHESMDVISPLDGSRISSLPLSTDRDVDNAVKAAKKAFPAWSAMTFKERVQIFFRYRTLLEKNIEELKSKNAELTTKNTDLVELKLNLESQNRENSTKLKNLERENMVL